MALDWLPTLVDIAGGPKGDGLKSGIGADDPGFVNRSPRRRRSGSRLSKDQHQRDCLFSDWYAPVSRDRQYKNWKFYYTMAPSSATGGLTGTVTYHWTQVDNIKRDPFEQAVAEDQKTLLGMGGAIAAPSTAYIYDWNLVPIGQLLWLKELETFPHVSGPAVPSELQSRPDHPGHARSKDYQPRG